MLKWLKEVFTLNLTEAVFLPRILTLLSVQTWIRITRCNAIFSQVVHDLIIPSRPEIFNFIERYFDIETIDYIIYMYFLMKGIFGRTF